MPIVKRTSLHWPESESVPSPEQTNTLAITTPNGSYVDIRPYKPEVVEANPSLKSFPFQWAFAGQEIVVSEDPLKVQFTRAVADSIFIEEYCRCCERNLPLPKESDIPVDLGTFFTRSDGTIEETGKLLNPSTSNVETYIELWSIVDPVYSNKVILLDVLDNSRYKGRFIRLGNWSQGLLWDKQSPQSPMSIIRSTFKKGKWVSLIKYGLDSCLMEGLEDLTLHEEQVVVSKDVTWICKEC